MAKLIDSLAALRGDVRAVRLAIETGVAAHARHVSRGKDNPDLWAETKCAHCGKGAMEIVGRVALCGKCAILAKTEKP